MEAFFLCWMFDKRWLFGLPNPCTEFALIIPALLNFATLIAILLERAHINIEVESSFILLLTLYLFLAILSIILLVQTYRRAEEKMGQVQENVDAIRQLRHSLYFWLDAASWRRECGAGWASAWQSCQPFSWESISTTLMLASSPMTALPTIRGLVSPIQDVHGLGGMGMDRSNVRHLSGLQAGLSILCLEASWEISQVQRCHQVILVLISHWLIR